MTPAQLAAAQQALLAKLKAAGVTLRTATLLPGNGKGDDGDRAVAAVQADELVGRRESKARDVAACLAALARIEEGTYGDCATCGRPIAAARLKAIPEAADCIDCAEAAERRARPVRRPYFEEDVC